MSKIGKKPIAVPKGVDIKVDGHSVSVKGPKGEMKRTFPAVVSVSVNDGNVSVGMKDSAGDTALWGLTRALLANMIKGVTDGFEKALEFDGVGYKAAVKGTSLEMSLGYSHPIIMEIPAGLEIKVEKAVIKVSGIDKDLVGKFSAEIKSKRLPEPYKGHGIKYSTEVLRRKAGKKAATAA